jgi:hypothetical protein
MTITVSEALRLKNEISKTIQALHSETHRAPLGLTKEDNEVVTDEADSKKFGDAIFRLEKALLFSEEINSVISSFNKTNKIDDKVRSMHNQKLLLSVFENALGRTKPTKTTKFENLGNGVRKSIKVEYVPMLTSTEVKSKISTYKTNFRTIQNEVEILNQQTIDLTFSYEDTESLVSAE